MEREERGALFDDTDLRHSLTRGLLTLAWGGPAWELPGVSPCTGPRVRTGWLWDSQGAAGWRVCLTWSSAPVGTAVKPNFKMMTSAVIMDHESAYGDREAGHHKAS